MPKGQPTTKESKKESSVHQNGRGAAAVEHVPGNATANAGPRGFVPTRRVAALPQLTRAHRRPRTRPRKGRAEGRAERLRPVLRADRGQGARADVRSAARTLDGSSSRRRRGRRADVPWTGLSRHAAAAAAWTSRGQDCRGAPPRRRGRSARDRRAPQVRGARPRAGALRPPALRARGAPDRRRDVPPGRLPGLLQHAPGGRRSRGGRRGLRREPALRFSKNRRVRDVHGSGEPVQVRAGTNSLGRVDGRAGPGDCRRRRGRVAAPPRIFRGRVAAKRRGAGTYIAPRTSEGAPGPRSGSSARHGSTASCSS